MKGVKGRGARLQTPGEAEGGLRPEASATAAGGAGGSRRWRLLSLSLEQERRPFEAAARWRRRQTAGEAEGGIRAAEAVAAADGSGELFFSFFFSVGDGTGGAADGGGGGFDACRDGRQGSDAAAVRCASWG